MCGLYYKGNIKQVLELIEGVVEVTADKEGKVLDYIRQAKEIKNSSRAD